MHSNEVTLRFLVLEFEGTVRRAYPFDPARRFGIARRLAHRLRPDTSFPI
jgi:hypothetical protein